MTAPKHKRVAPPKHILERERVRNSPHARAMRQANAVDEGTEHLLCPECVEPALYTDPVTGVTDCASCGHVVGEGDDV